MTNAATSAQRVNGSKPRTVRVGLYARVSTDGQTPENQLQPLRAFAAARGWVPVEFIDHGISGAKDRRPALDALLAAVRGRKVDVVAVTKLDRLARSTRHLVTLAAEFEALGVDLTVLEQAIDTTTPAGRLLFHVLAAISEFERDLIRDRVMAGLRRARSQGRRLGRPRLHEVDDARARALLAEGRSLRATARALGVPHVAVSRALALTNGWNKSHARAES
jgi:DNA invertase Pin-like site-specific DNA recombinase